MLFRKERFIPGNDLCTFFVDAYDKMPRDKQSLLWGVCTSYNDRCSNAETWGEITDLWKSGDKNPTSLMTRLQNDKCAPLVHCSNTSECSPYYTKTKCVNGVCQ
jgi:hypothetical protein